MAGSLRVEVRPGQYRDSIVLMVASARMSAAPGVEAAMAAMATPLNLDLLRESGLWSAALERAGPGDLVLAARGADPESGLRVAEAVLSERAATPPAGDVPAPRTVRTASRLLDGANIAVVSVPGEHAAWACWDALAQGLNVFCFSDHVSLADEVRLKDEALRRGLLMMGPDCGTAIINGVPLAFANVVARGTIGWPSYPAHTPSTLDFTTRARGDTWFQPRWSEAWFPEAFRGTMGDLLLSLAKRNWLQVTGPSPFKVKACSAQDGSVLPSRTPSSR